MEPVLSPQATFERVFADELDTVVHRMTPPEGGNVAATFRHPLVNGEVLRGKLLDSFDTLADAKAAGFARPGTEVVLKDPVGRFCLYGAKVKRFLAPDRLPSGLSGVIFERLATNVEAVLDEGDAAAVTEFSRDSLKRLDVIRLLLKKGDYDVALNAVRILADFDSAVAQLGYYLTVQKMVALSDFESDPILYEARSVLKEYRALMADTQDSALKSRYYGAYWAVENAISRRRGGRR